MRDLCWSVSLPSHLHMAEGGGRANLEPRVQLLMFIYLARASIAIANITREARNQQAG